MVGFKLLAAAERNGSRTKAVGGHTILVHTVWRPFNIQYSMSTSLMDQRRARCYLWTPLFKVAPVRSVRSPINKQTGRPHAISAPNFPAFVRSAMHADISSLERFQLPHPYLLACSFISLMCSRRVHRRPLQWRLSGASDSEYALVQ